MTRGRALACLAAMAAAACARGPAVRDLDTITVAVQFSPNNLDPRVGSDEVAQHLHQLLFSSLVKKDAALRVVPDAAESWETPDDRTYVFHLRRGVRFHDGRELTAADVAYTFGSLLDERFISPKKAAYRMIASVRAVDRYMVVFRLKAPFGSFSINLVLGIVPAGTGPEGAMHPIGTGPYRFVRHAVDDQVVLERFDGYFGGRARTGRLVFKVVPDDTMRGLELRKGSVDLVVNDLSPDIVYQLQRTSALRVTRREGTDYTYLGFNLRDPVLGDRRVRQAIALAIDRKAIVDYLRRGLAVPAVGILPPACWAFEPNVPRFDYDPARARVLLDEAGYRDPDGAGAAPRLRLTLKVSTSEFYRLQAAVIQQDLAGVGIALDVRSYEFATLYTDVTSGNFQLFTLQWVGVSDPDMLRRVFHSAQVPPAGFNRGYYSNSEVDALLDRATSSTDDRLRRELYARVQQIVAADVPYVSLWYKTNVAVSQPDIRGVSLFPAADYYFLEDVYHAADLERAAR